MEALGVSCVSSFYKPTPIHKKTNFNKSTPIPRSCFSSTSKNTSRSTKVFTSLSSSSKVSPENVDPPEAELETEIPMTNLTGSQNGNGRLLKWGTVKTFGSWIENIIPKWILHILSNLVVDSDLYLLHIEVHTFKKACVGVYPSNEMVWFWPSTDPKYTDIVKKKKPPFIPELDDPSSTNFFMNRDFPYGFSPSKSYLRGKEARLDQLYSKYN